MRFAQAFSTLLDFALIAFLYFAAFAWGARSPVMIYVFAAGSILLLGCRIILEAARGEIRVILVGAYLPALGLLALAAMQLANPRVAPGSASILLPHTVEPHTTEAYLFLGVGFASLALCAIHGFSTRKQAARLAVALIALGALQALYGIFQSLTGYTSVWEPPFHSDSAHGSLANHNHYALLLNLAICLGVGFLYKRAAELFQGRNVTLRRIMGMSESAQLLWIIFWISLMGLGVILSLSRAGIFAMLVCTGAMMVAAGVFSSGRFARRLVLAAMLAIACFGIYAGVDAALARYTDILAPGYFEQDRLPIWRDSWRMIKTNPLFGQGVGSFQWTFPAYETWEPDKPAVYAHNDYLQMAAECGLIGLGLIIWLFAACWKRAAQNIKGPDFLQQGIGLAAIGALTATAIQEITDYSLYTPVVAAILICILALNERLFRGFSSRG